MVPLCRRFGLNVAAGFGRLHLFDMVVVRIHRSVRTPRLFRPLFCFRCLSFTQSHWQPTGAALAVHPVQSGFDSNKSKQALCFLFFDREWSVESLIKKYYSLVHQRAVVEGK